MSEVKTHIDKDFWEVKHQTSDKYWLTGSSLGEIMNFHELTEDDIRDKKVLDLGVGLGNLSKELINYTDELICCDISEKALSNVDDKVNKKYLTTNLKEIEPVDLAICHLVFQHCTNQEIERIINDVVLKDGGTFTFQFAYLRDNESPNSTVMNLIELGSHHFRDLKHIEKMVDKSDKEIVWVSKPYDFHYPENFSWLIVKLKNKKN